MFSAFDAPRPGFDPRVPICAFLSVALWIGTCRTTAGAAMWTVLAVAIAWGLRRSLTAAPPVQIPLLRWALPMALLVAALYTLLQPGGAHPLGRLGPLQISAEGLNMGARLGLRLLAFAGLATAVTSRANPSALAAGVTRLLLPLRVIGLQVASLYYLMFFMFRMYPLLTEELQTVRMGQRSRGVRFDGPWHTRIRASTAIVIPAFAAALRRADRLSAALASRGFDVRRVPGKVLSIRFARRDWVATLLLAIGWMAWLAGRLLTVDLVLF